MPVQQHVLNWLYSVLTSEYHDVNRTYNDVAQALARYPSLAPRTDVHTFPNGASALLLHLSGTLPVDFRGNTYRFPMSIWVPHAYPREPPLLYVTPTDSMAVRPGQHVDPQGQVYHPYLAGWAQYWDKSTLHDFLAVLSDVFAKEPPVVARQQGRPPPNPQPVQSPPPVPPLPPEMDSTPIQHRAASTSSQSSPRPPPPPPKPHTGGRPYTSQQGDAGPPLPPIPSDSPSAAPRPSRYDSAPPLPPQGHGPASPGHQQPRPFPQHQTSHMSPHAVQAMPPFGPTHYPPPNNQPGFGGPGQGHWQNPGQAPPAWSAAPPTMQQQPRQQAPPPPPADLMDEPLALNIPTQAIAAPPIPPNPEKDALLRQMAQTLASIRQRDRQQNESSMAGLQAQRAAMQSAMPALQSEMGQLTQLSNLLTSNTNILHDALHKADSVIEGSRSHPAPELDDLLVAPTVVSNQLYTLVAEERALGDAIFMLGRAVERGRISPAVFAKMTRSLAREWYLKKALVRKIGQGMGLAPP